MVRSTSSAWIGGTSKKFWRLAGAYSELKNICVWTKNNGDMGSLYRSQHELVFVVKSGTERHINNVELGKHGRYRTNVWRAMLA